MLLESSATGDFFIAATYRELASFVLSVAPNKIVGFAGCEHVNKAME
jgi:hypothetical protein